MSENLKHMFNLTIGTSTEGEYNRAFKQMEGFHREVSLVEAKYPYVSQYSSVVDDESEVQPGEELYFNEDTRLKVYTSIQTTLRRLVGDEGTPLMKGMGRNWHDVIQNLIRDIEQDGIIFRERR